MERHQKSQRGMTLIEVILSLAILGIIIAPTAAFFANSFKYNNFSQEQMEANQLAQKYMEEYKSKSFSELIPIIGAIPKSDNIGMNNFTTSVVLTGTPVVGMHYDATITIPSTYPADTLPLQMTADATGVSVNDKKGVPIGGSPYQLTLAEPITVMIKQDGAASQIITMELKNKTSYTLQVTKLTQDATINLNSIEGKIEMITQDDVQTPEARYQEAGITITVTVFRQSDKVKLAELSQIKMTN